MKDFKKQSKFSRSGPGGARPSFGGRPSFGFGARNSDGPKEMFEASCNKCGNKCEVPFLPNGKKPVYCRDCFVREDGQDSRNNFIKKEWTPKPSFDRAPAGHGPAAHGGPDMKDVVRELVAVNAKLDTLIRVMQEAA